MEIFLTKYMEVNVNFYFFTELLLIYRINALLILTLSEVLLFTEELGDSIREDNFQ